MRQRPFSPGRAPRITMPVVTAPILPGAEPFSAAGGDGGVLVLHGFTGNPQSMRSLAEAFAKAGHAVDLPLLPGHGTAVEDLIPKRWSDWAEAAEAAYAELAARCSRVVAAGLSMGGLLALWLATRHDDLAGVAAINPFVEEPAQSFRDILVGILATGSLTLPAIGSDICRPGVEESAYAATPIEAALSLFDAAGEVAADLGKIHCPVLLFSSRQDHVVPTTSGDRVAAEVAGPVERVWIERSYHVATLDWDREEVESRAVSFAGTVFGAA